VSIKEATPIMRDTGGRLLPAMVRTVRAHASFLDFLSLLWRKFALIWHWYEIPNNTNYYYFQEYAGVLKWLPLNFAVVASLALPGVWLSFFRRQRPIPLYLLLITHLIPMVVFYVSSRFRLPLLGALIPFAALTITRIAAIRSPNPGRWAVVLLCVLALYAGISRKGGVTGLIRLNDYRFAYLTYFDPLASHYLAEGNEEGVWRTLEQYLAVCPAEQIDRIVETGVAATKEDVEIAKWYAEVYSRYAEALLQTGRSLEAERAGETARALERSLTIRTAP
jgi:hypothetical protein